MVAAAHSVARRVKPTSEKSIAQTEIHRVE